MSNNAATEKPVSAEHADGATVRCCHDSNRQLCRSFSLLLAKRPIRAIEQPTNLPKLRSAVRELAERIEARLLLTAQRRIELIQCRLHQFGCLKHGLEPLFHRSQPSDRRERHVLRAGSLQPLSEL